MGEIREFRSNGNGIPRQSVPLRLAAVVGFRQAHPRAIHSACAYNWKHHSGSRILRRSWFSSRHRVRNGNRPLSRQVFHHFAAARACRDRCDASGGPARRLVRSSGCALAFSPLILMFAVLIELMTVRLPLWGSKIIGTHAQNRLTLIPLLSIGPLICLLLALRNGASLRPGLAGAIAGLAASGIAATFYPTNSSLPGIRLRQDLWY
jgi:hypothetical protein